MPKLSVITPIYNCEKYLRESIESILDQSFTDFEFIIVNDGSTDSCEEIVRSYKDDRIVFINNLDNKKIPTRRNEAISIAKSDYIAIHDGDDISLPERFSLQMKEIDGTELFCVGGHAVKIDLDGNKTGDMDYPPADNKGCLDMVFKCYNPIIDSTTIFRKNKFMDLGMYPLEESIYTVPDFDLWLRAWRKDLQFINLQQPLIKYRDNPASVTGSKKKLMIRHHMIVWRRFMLDYRKQRHEKFRQMDSRRDR